METEKKLQVKKEWKTPELIVLVRSKPEEAVLGACKSSLQRGKMMTRMCAIGTGVLGHALAWSAHSLTTP